MQFMYSLSAGVHGPVYIAEMRGSTDMYMVALMETVGLQVALKAIALLVIETVF